LKGEVQLKPELKHMRLLPNMRTLTVTYSIITLSQVHYPGL